MAGDKTTSAPNYFDLLGLSPADPWDEKKFEQALEAKRSEWARKSNMVGNVAMEAKRNLSRYAEIQRVMSDPVERDIQAIAAQKEHEVQHKARLEELHRQVEITNGKGVLEQTELDKFVADFKDTLSEREIRKLIRVPVKAPEAQQTSGTQLLDPTTLKTINEGLHFLQKSDLYELLGLSDLTSNLVLSKAAQELYEDMQRRQPKTPEVTATSMLAGHARIIFKTDEMRRKYNESQHQGQLTALLEEFEKSVNRGKEKTLHIGQVTLFLKKAREGGWSEEEARARLQEYARLRKWFLEMPVLEKEADELRCGNCKAPNPKEQKICKRCGSELLIICPDCGQRVPPDEAGCGKCGFPVGNRYEVDNLLADCRDLLVRKLVEQAEQKLRGIEDLWSPKTPDKRGNQIQEMRKEVQQLLQNLTESTKHIETLLSQHQFFTARAYLTRQTSVLINQASYAQKINDAIAHAQALLKQASMHSAADSKTDLCLQALQICADYQEAKDLLRMLPPSAPSNLQFRENGSTISLQWTTSPTRNVNYQIIRKTGSPPISPNDGLVLATVSGHIYEDTQPEIGLPTFYAVFATLADIPSRDAALLQRPVFLLRNVTEVKTRVDSQRVELSWQAHSRIAGLWIVRKEQTPPTSSNDGIHLIPLDHSHLVDDSVENGHLYYYAIYSQFTDYAGKLIHSDGVVVSARPEAAPSPIMSLDIESHKTTRGHEVRLRWSAPEKGQAAILKSRSKPSLRVGETIAQNDLTTYGQILVDKPDSFTDTWTQSDVAYYTPLVIFQGIVYAGPSRRVAVIDDVSDLRYQNLGSAIRLNWTWPANCHEVLVTYDHQTWPQLDETTQRYQKVTRIEYEHRGYHDIKGIPNADHYIVVAAVIIQGDDRIIGSGLRLHARLVGKIVIIYEIKIVRHLLGPKKRLLQVTVRGSVVSLPTLLLMTKQGRLPLRKEEGELLYRLNGSAFVENILEKELPEKTFAPRTFGKLYLEDDKMYEAVTIHHPSEEKLRLA